LLDNQNWRIVLGTLDSTFTDCLEAMEESLVSREDTPKEDIIKGIGLLKSRFSQKMDPICSKLEVSSSVSLKSYYLLLKSDKNLLTNEFFHRGLCWR
jgi:hypothetical protein